MVVFNLKESHEVEAAMAMVTDATIAGASIEIKKKSKGRTITQNAALHLMFTKLADELNNNGLDQRKVLNESIDIPWNSDSVKDFLWRPIQKIVTKKDSTTDLATNEIDKVFKLLQRHLNQKLNIGINFPSIETLIREQQDEEFKRKNI